MTLREALIQSNTKEEIRKITMEFINLLNTKDILQSETKLSSMINELIHLSVKPTEAEDVKETIVVYRHLDVDEDNFYSSYSTYIVRSNDNDNHYGYADTGWEDVINVDILDASITRYGLPVCIATILDEMSWHGFDYQTIKENQKEFWERIQGIRDKIEENKEDNIDEDTFDDASLANDEDLTFSDITEEEKQRYKEQLNICLEWTKQELAVLLSE